MGHPAFQTPSEALSPRGHITHFAGFLAFPVSLHSSGASTSWNQTFSQPPALQFWSPGLRLGR